MKHTPVVTACLALLLFVAPCLGQVELIWEELPPIPNELGVAGPIVGVQKLKKAGKIEEVLIVAGGANFPTPVGKTAWDIAKQWHDDIFLLAKDEQGSYAWSKVGKLPKPMGYSACVSLSDESFESNGILVMGGNNAEQTFDDVFRLRWNGTEIEIKQYPSLPRSCVHGQAVVVDGAVYLAGGQSGSSLDTAMDNLWRMKLRKENAAGSNWDEISSIPGSPRALNLTLAQDNGFERCLYLISGRTSVGGTAESPTFLQDVWEYSPAKNTWRERAPVPSCVMAGTGIDFSNSYLYVLGGDDGSLFGDDVLRENHPGFGKRAFVYHTITDRWIETNETAANHVTSQAVKFDGKIVIPSGEIRPRIRSPKVWSVQTAKRPSSFGVVNYAVLFGYLAAMVGVGIYFAKKNKDTDDYFRGGKRIPWWAAGCSIYATMLSSLTYTGIPSKAFQEDWVVAVMNFTVPVIGLVAVLFALPFYRRIDATSAYEYLQRRFGTSVRLFGSASFVTFHVFRMAVVLALTGLALQVATPLTPQQCVLLMGVLSIIYCTVGGIEAVIWTDTIQTVVLLGGALVAVFYLMSGIDGGFAGFLAEGNAANKFEMAHYNFDLGSAQVAIWFIVLGGLAQNLSSYTADQAVIQRYMTTSSEKLAAKSIWTNCILVIPTTILFFGIGSALYAFYRSHPERLDPNVTADQIFPLFISRELPIGIAGLIVAGIFAAAQSTVSTSMNSMATTVVTDFLRPFNVFASEKRYLLTAKMLTFTFGVLGTLVGLWFVDPNIKSRFDEFIKVLGLFMGVLGGLFILGALTTRANAKGALVGALIGAAVMFALWRYSDVTGYMYTFFGIATCVITGYVFSLLLPSKQQDLTGLTVYTLNSPRQ